MVWMKISSKGWSNIAKVSIIVIISGLLIFTGVHIGAGSDSKSKDDTSINIDGENALREDLGSIREGLGDIKSSNEGTIGVITSIIDNTTEISTGIVDLDNNLSESRELTEGLTGDSVKHTGTIRDIQDSTLRSELIADELQRLIGSIERENNYNNN